ncbi:MAG: hypothetical protein AAF704_13070 [Cyanobacteria bacterium P01_D01_bin.123]
MRRRSLLSFAIAPADSSQSTAGGDVIRGAVGQRSRWLGRGWIHD